MTKPRPNDFAWAHGPKANLKEPFDDLKEQGWNYGDTPTAANFNWLFQEIGTWHQYLESRSDQTADES